MEVSDWSVVVGLGKDEWKCTCQEVGAQYVMMTGMTPMLQWYADSWDTPQMAR